jgi:5-methyltetrahydrofolate--homocysteine methyltransferase
MQELFDKLAKAIERGKINIDSPYPQDLKGQEGASELTEKLLNMDIPPEEILNNGLMVGMKRIGDKFGAGEAFIPELLISAKAMNAAMIHLQKYFDSGEVQHKGSFIIGTVSGDLHDIGKNLVKLVVEGNGWQVIDLGTDVSSDKFLNALSSYPQSYVGLSALLTTTMVNMEFIVKEIKKKFPQTKVFIGGAPLTNSYSDKIHADGYFPNPQALIRYMDTVV